MSPSQDKCRYIILFNCNLERHREHKKDPQMVLIDLKKGYDEIPRNVMWWALDKLKVPIKHITLI
jgi:hypothetical protein